MNSKEVSSYHTELYESIIHSDNNKAITALHFIKDTVKQYGFSDIALSFNGGKDCTVLLELLLAVLNHLNLPASQLTILYFKDPLEFKEITEFLHNTAAHYQLTYTIMSGHFMQELNTLLRSSTTSGIRAIFMGQRSTDPGGTNLQLISPSDTDGGWMPFDRINPLLEWSYGEIWLFIRQFNTRYCVLYDAGYTSIGNRLNSRPNPQLQVPNESRFLPASQLTDWNKERDSRLSTNKSN